MKTIGKLLAGILGGPRAGALAGLLGGGFYVTRVEPEAFPWALIASLLDGWLAGRMSVRREQMFVGWRVLGSAAVVQIAGLTVTAAGMAYSGTNPIGSLPSLGTQLAGVAVGVALFVNVALVVISRQEQAVALVEAQAAANALSLTALRSSRSWLNCRPTAGTDDSALSVDVRAVSLASKRYISWTYDFISCIASSGIFDRTTVNKVISCRCDSSRTK